MDELRQFEDFVSRFPRLEVCLEALTYTFIIAAALLAGVWWFNGAGDLGKRGQDSRLARALDAREWISSGIEGGFVASYVTVAESDDAGLGLAVGGFWPAAWPYKNEVMVRVPESQLITEDSVLEWMPELRGLGAAGHDPHLLMAGYLLAEFSKGSASVHARYFATLPSLGSMRDHPVLRLKGKLLATLARSRSARRIKKFRSRLLERAEALRAFMARKPQLFDENYRSREVAAKAILLVSSRSTMTAIGEYGIMVMAPIADLSNHNGHKHELAWRWSEDVRALELVADHEIVIGRGQELCMHYGVPFDNVQLLTTRGFSELDNKFHKLEFELPVTRLQVSYVTTRSIKKKRLASLGLADQKLKLKNSKANGGGGGGLVLPLTFEACWYITPDQLMAARVAVATREEVDAGDGMFAFPGPEKDREFLERIRSLVLARLREYPHTPETDAKLLTDSTLSSVERVVVGFRLTEKRILVQKAAVLQHVITALAERQARVGVEQGSGGTQTREEYERVLAGILREAHHDVATLEGLKWDQGFCKDAANVWKERRPSWPDEETPGTMLSRARKFVVKYIGY